LGGRGGAGGSGNCIVAIQGAGYASPPAQPCSACNENGASRQTQCQQVIDCLAPLYPCLSSNCILQCQNQAGASNFVASCVQQLISAGCPLN
jgi:hypothetical protein